MTAPLSAETLLLLCFFAFLAGFIDAIVGGGGLVQLPALFLFLPASVPLPVILGTGKLASVCGTAVAGIRYVRQVPLPWRAVAPFAGAAFACSWLGARLVSHLDKEAVRPLILVLLVAVALYTYLRKDFGTHHQPRYTGRQVVLPALASGVGIGLYNGFFGPGTGSFAVFLFISRFGFSFLHASASTKIVNVAADLSALIYFAVTGSIWYGLALPLAAANIAGGWLGARLAVARGSRFVRGFFLLVVAAIITKFAWDTFTS